MTTTTPTALYTETREMLIAEMLKECPSSRLSPDDCILVQVSGMWDDYYGIDDIAGHQYLLMAPERDEWVCRLYIPTRLSPYRMGCITSVHTKYVSIVNYDFSAESIAPTSQCDHDCDWDHHYDDDSLLGDYYHCSRCGDLTQVG
jgi:hypothetical protein